MISKVTLGRRGKEVERTKEKGREEKSKWGRPKVPAQKGVTTPVCEGSIFRRGFASNTKPTAPTNGREKRPPEAEQTLWKIMWKKKRTWRAAPGF